jgi:UDP-N-acetylmuramate-alanine ligase
MTLKDIKAVYFVGAGGIGMSAIARYFIKKGLVVAGYDKAFLDKVAGDGAHADATCSYEIHSFDIF